MTRQSIEYEYMGQTTEAGQGRKKPVGGWAWFGGAMIAVVLLVTWCMQDDGTHTGTFNTPGLNSAVMDIGGVGMLRSMSGGANVYLTRTPEAYHAFVKAAGADDLRGIDDLFASGVLYSIPSGSAQAKLLDFASVGTIEVRVLSGPYEGERAWTAVESLQK
jgi:hypothetical protein